MDSAKGLIEQVAESAELSDDRIIGPGDRGSFDSTVEGKRTGQAWRRETDPIGSTPQQGELPGRKVERKLAISPLDGEEGRSAGATGLGAHI
jgi:hypothetical protein